MEGFVTGAMPNPVICELNVKKVESVINVFLLSACSFHGILSYTDAFNDRWLINHKQNVTVRTFNNLDSFSSLKDAKCDLLIVSELLEHNEPPSDKLMDVLLEAVKNGGHVLWRQDKLKSDFMLARLTQCIEVYTKVSDATVERFLVNYVGQSEDSLHANRNPVDFIWCLKKTTSTSTQGKDCKSEPHVSLRDFLDSTQYVDKSVSYYEWIFGHGFISPGGAEQNLHFARFLHLAPCQRMLDVGCGIGGSPMQLAKEYGCHVTGVDLSSNMLEVFASRLKKHPDSRIRLMLADVMNYDFSPATFDCVYSRDCIPHIEGKNKLFKKFHSWLKPGGRVLVTTYALGSGEMVPGGNFDKYVKQRHYDLLGEDSFQQICSEAGFAKVEVHDMTKNFRDILLNEIDRAKQRKADFLKEFSEKAYDELLSGWRDKIGYIDNANLVWFRVSLSKHGGILYKMYTGIQ